MLNNSVKIFLIFLSLCITSPTYSMEEEERNNHPLRDFFARQVAKSGFVFTREQHQANFDFEKTIHNFVNKLVPQETKKVIEKLDKILHQGANIDRINFEGKSEPHYILSFRSFDYQLLEYLLKRGANANFSGFKHLPTLLYVAADYSHHDVMKLLIKYGADIKHRNEHHYTLLGYVIMQDWDDNKATIKHCCKLKASLINVDYYGRSALHLAIMKQYPVQTIKTILTNARFDQEEIDDEELDKQLKEAAISTLLVLKGYSIPEELQLLILDELTSMHDIQGFNQKLSQFLYTKDHCKNLITQTKKRDNEFKKIAEFKDRNGHSALDRLNWLLTSPIPTENQYAQSIQPLLTGKQYKIDIDEFTEKKGNVSKKNLALAPLYN